MTPLSRLVPIRTVCAMYNLNPNTLRTWERRYGIIAPQRSEGGHRGYGEQDLANIELMLRLMAEGLSPAEAAEGVRQAAPGPRPIPPPDRVAELRQAFRDAVRDMNHTATLAAVHTAGEELGYRDCVESVLFPELAHWGNEWAAHGCGVAAEHVATLAVQAFLYDRQGEIFPQSGGKTVTVACAPDEEHLLPVVHVANLLAGSGQLTPLILVGGLPIEEILESSARRESQAIVLSATMTPRPDVVREWISLIVQAGWESRTVLVGGGFGRSRIFSETQVKSATGGYDQVLKVLLRMLDQKTPASGRRTRRPPA